jgi:hypothetical protein
MSTLELKITCRKDSKVGEVIRSMRNANAFTVVASLVNATNEIEVTGEFDNCDKEKVLRLARKYGGPGFAYPELRKNTSEFVLLPARKG